MTEYEKLEHKQDVTISGIVIFVGMIVVGAFLALMIVLLDRPMPHTVALIKWLVFGGAGGIILCMARVAYLEKCRERLTIAKYKDYVQAHTKQNTKKDCESQ